MGGTTSSVKTGDSGLCFATIASASHPGSLSVSEEKTRPDQHSADPHGSERGEDEAGGPIRPPRAPIGLPLLPNGCYQLPEGNPCEGCDHCCRYVTIPIETPRSRRDFDNIRWYLLHKNVSVLCDWEGSWMVQFDTPCDWLKHGKCSHYALRPEVCREYDPADCERYCPTPAEKILLSNEKDLEQFLLERDARREARRKRSSRSAR